MVTNVIVAGDNKRDNNVHVPVNRRLKEGDTHDRSISEKKRIVSGN